ncbi:hypothetical protein GA0074692_2216 [Micromonospora pallida]|uniref:Uncharacterized protein n=1 Tax=Micromonospora pallida TaxID=145854 RepID=A0A1C6SB48_9ACTN|nr:hypothetical protein [Micromonospora pallida]SCL26700.1 hypothetical protein GA0074692_2216 [Micromonospora pallida]
MVRSLDGYADLPIQVSTRRELAEALRKVKDGAGLSYREIHDESDRLCRATAGRAPDGWPRIRLPRSTVESVLNGRNLPSAEVLAMFLLVCRVPPEQVHAWRAAVDRLRGAAERPPATPPVWTVAEFPPSAAGVHRAVTPPGRVGAVPDDEPRPEHPGEWWTRPSYVVRDHDHELRERLAAAATAGGGFVLVTGRSCAGKTRSLWEAVRDNHAGWRVVRPRDAEQLRALPGAGSLGARTVVWLDELQRYLAGDGQRGIGADEVRALWAARKPVVVVATLWPTLYDELVSQGTQTLSDPHEPARNLLRLAGTPVRVPDRLQASELDRAWEAARDDAQLTAALTDPDHGMTQVLAGAPWLVQRWEQPRFAYTRSVLSVAVAARRLGVRGPVSADLLRHCAHAYFPDRRPAPAGWFDRALGEATDLIRDTVSALVPERDPDDDERAAGYGLTDYLAQYTADGRDVEPVPEAVWRALTRHIVDPGDLLHLAREAKSRLLYRFAEGLYRQALAAGHEWAHGELVALLAEQKRFDEAIAEQRSARAEDRSAQSVLVDLLVAAGRKDELRALAETDSFARIRFQHMLAEHGAVDEIVDLLGMLEDDQPAIQFVAIQALAAHGRRTGTFDELLGLAESGDSWAAGASAQLLWDQGRRTAAVDLVRRRGADTHGYLLARWLLHDGRVDEALEELRRHGATPDVVALLVEFRRVDELRALSADPHALRSLAWLLHGDGRTDEALGLLRGAPSDEYCQCPLRMLATILADSGRQVEAIEELRWAGRTHGPVADLLARLLAESERLDELKAMADAGNAWARREWARRLAARGRIDEAVELLLLEAYRTPEAVDDLGMILADHDRVEEAFKIVRRYSEPVYTGDRCARLAYLLAEQERLGDLQRAAAENVEAGRYLSVLLALRQPPEQLARATVGGDRRARDALIRLAVLGNLRDGAHLRRFGLNPDGSMALNRENSRSAIPIIERPPRKDELLFAISLW